MHTSFGHFNGQLYIFILRILLKAWKPVRFLLHTLIHTYFLVCILILHTHANYVYFIFADFFAYFFFSTHLLLFPYWLTFIISVLILHTNFAHFIYIHMYLCLVYMFIAYLFFHTCYLVCILIFFLKYA